MFFRANGKNGEEVVLGLKPYPCDFFLDFFIHTVARTTIYYGTKQRGGKRGQHVVRALKLNKSP